MERESKATTFAIAVLTIAVVLAAVVGVMNAQDRQLTRAPLPSNSIERVIDTTLGVVCYVFQESGSLSCVKLGR